jgi:hypothetical protein
MGPGEKAAGLAPAERAIAANSVEKDAVSRPAPIQVLAAVEAQMGEPDRAIVAALRQLLSIPVTYGYSRATYFRSAPARSNVRSAPK